MYNCAMSSSMTVSEARSALPEVIQRVEAGEEVTLTRHGVPVAVVVAPSALRVRRAQATLDAAAVLGRRLDAYRGLPLGEAKTISTDRAEQLVADAREARRRH
jgi:prevent-host-death family protein